MNRFRNVVLRKCKSLSRVAGRPSASSYSYSSLRSMSTRDATAAVVDGAADADYDAAAAVASVGSGAVAVLVGSSRRRYVISAEHLSHPLIAALIDDDGRRKDQPIAVNCEVVLFDHLLWMLDNAVDLHGEGDDDAMRELAQLYAC